MPGDNQIPKGLVFFAPDASPAYKRRRIIFAVIASLACLSIIWPIYPLFSTIYPMLFSIPFSLGWLVIWLIITMGALSWLYKSESQ
ncbi:MAG: hypothetical protein AB8G77_18635 [Rhodothermales bacterium]